MSEATKQDATRDAISEQGVRVLRRVQRARAERDERKARAEEYIKQVRAEVEQDLEPAEREAAEAQRELEAFIKMENDGKKFGVPGLGTAYFTSRTSVTIEDERAFVDSLPSRLDAEEIQSLFQPPKLIQGDAKKLIQAVLKEDGEQLPGTTVQDTESLTVKLS